MATENTSPTLYSLYDKQYDFNELQREADAGVHEYISRLRRGSKDAEQFLKAYSDIMTGIQDGSITFKDGRFIDSRGRYANGQYYDKDNNVQTSKKSSRDYYGLMANYVYGKLRNQNEYTPPEDKTKIKWNGTDSIKLAVTRNIMNSDTWNNDYFMDLNDYDKETGKVVGNDKRISTFSNALTYVRDNFDNLFTGYSDTDKANAITNLDQALENLKDNSVSHDYLSLKRAAGDLGYATIFGDKQVQAPTQNTEQNQRRLAFYKWLGETYPYISQGLGNRSLKSVHTINGNDARALQSLNIPDTDLDRVQQAVALYIMSGQDIFKNLYPSVLGNTNIDSNILANTFLTLLLRKHKLTRVDNDNYIIPKTINTNRNTVYVWNISSKTVKETSLYDIPSWRDERYNEFQSRTPSQDGDNNFYESRFGSYQFKKGGVIKAQTGVSLTENANYYTGVFKPTLDYILERIDALNDEDKGKYIDWLNHMQDSHYELYSAATKGGKGFYKTAYSDDKVKDYQDAYKSGFNDEFSDNAGYNTYGITNAINKKMFDVSGPKRNSGDWNIGNNKWTSDKLFSAITDYRRLLGRDKDFSDEQLAYIENAFKERGYNFYRDENGYYKLKALEKDTQENPVEIPAEPPVNTPTDNTEDSENNSSYINPWQEFKRQRSNNYKEYLQRISPETLGLARLFSSLRTNHKILNTVKKSLNPVLKQTYELYSPVTGAFSEMKLADNMAAQVNRQANEAFTSDASLQAARQLEANRQANELQRKGFLSDDAEIKRTKAEALKRQEDNIARRTEVANFNRASVNQTNRELAQLKASTMKANQQSINNYLTEVEGRVRDAIEKDIERRKIFKLNAAQQDIENQYYEVLQDIQDKADKWKKQEGNESKSLSEMPGYYGLLKELARWKNSQVLGAHANIYGYKYDDNKYIGVSPWEIASKYRLHKNGGTLRPSALYMINKVIRNENNS